MTSPPPVVVNNIIARPVFIARRPSFLAVLACLFLFHLITVHWQVFLVLAVLGVLGCVWYKRTEQQKQITARANQAYLNDTPSFLYPPTVFGQSRNRHEKEEE